MPNWSESIGQKWDWKRPLGRVEGKVTSFKGCKQSLPKINGRSEKMPPRRQREAAVRIRGSESRKARVGTTMS